MGTGWTASLIRPWNVARCSGESGEVCAERRAELRIAKNTALRMETSDKSSTLDCSVMRRLYRRRQRPQKGTKITKAIWYQKQSRGTMPTRLNLFSKRRWHGYVSS